MSWFFQPTHPHNESRYGVLWQEALLAAFRVGRWSLVADADEFLFWSLPDERGQVSGRSAKPCCVARTTATPNLCACPCWILYPSGPLAQAGFAHGPFADATHIDRAPLRCVPGMPPGPMGAKIGWISGHL